MSNKQFRIILRWSHIIGSGFIGTYLYSPSLAANAVFAGIVAYGIFPALALSGIALWQQPRIMKLIKGNRKAQESKS